MSRSGSGEPLVALLRRRGRFMVAEPLFAPKGRDDERRGGASGLIVGAARSSRGAKGGAGEGDIALVRAGSRGSNARVLRGLGKPEIARDVIEALMIDRGIRRRFGTAVEQEASEAGARVMARTDDRRDLRDLATFTIDPVSARDFDDAISAESLGGERARVWVHIADVSAHVREGSMLDREARRRATSVYVPGTVEPMLPHALSSDACSLRPGVDRPAVTVELETDGARVAKAAFFRSLIRSDERLDYDRVDRIFGGEERAVGPWAEPLGVARRVAAALQEQRERAGGLAIDSPEPEFVFDERGNVSEIEGQAQTESHRLIEQLMIAANEAVARHLSERKVPCLYRVHERPEPARVERLIDQLASLGVPTPAVPERMSPSQASELLGELSGRVQEHVARAEGQGGRALGSLILRSLKQAYYSPVNLGHAGLHSTAYCHFTSPIRRYPDIVCHRALLSTLGEPERPARSSEMAELGVWTSDREREAMVIERDADDIAACFALERLLRRDGPGQALEGEITGLISAGAFIAFAGPEGSSSDAAVFEGMLPVRLLRASRPARARREQAVAERSGAGGTQAGARGGASGARQRGRGGASGRRSDEEAREWWELNEEGTILYGERSGATLRLGDRVKVRVVRIEALRGRVDLEPAG
ncbi:MAG TPA: RNB domain-containing ribonuclease [Solirubrobacteraceae bacterium]|nr:RNB domain-containing ribonuclease [Solirubrobacteraceae bacterium]